jgi:hypothetical protein
MTLTKVGHHHACHTPEPWRRTQVFVVTGLVTRNKMFKGKNGLWHLAEYAA